MDTWHRAVGVPTLPYPNAKGAAMNLVSVKFRDVILTAAIAVTILFVVFFAPGVFHNAAHDLRHAFAIPCH